jgi:NACalpha-BTF3-like transcription factor
MKIHRSELKAIVKECLKELIDEGALNNIVREVIQTQQIPIQNINYGYPQQIPNVGVSDKVKKIAGSIAKTSEEAKLYEAIFSDSEFTMKQQTGADLDPLNIIKNIQMQAPNQDYYFQQPQNYMHHQQPQQQPQQQQFLHNIKGQASHTGHTSNQLQASRWASLAFNSPIKNRPDSNRRTGGI